MNAKMIFDGIKTDKLSEEQRRRLILWAIDIQERLKPVNNREDVQLQKKRISQIIGVISGEQNIDTEEHMVSCPYCLTIDIRKIKDETEGWKDYTCKSCDGMFAIRNQ